MIDAQIAGISGDMILSSLVSLGANKSRIIEGIHTAELFLDDSKITNIDFASVQKNGKDATQLILEVDENVEIDTSKKANVSGTPSGLMGWILKKMRYYNLMPKFAISDYLPRFVVKLIFRSVYKPTEKLHEDSRRDITERYYKGEIRSLEKLIDRDLSSWLS